MLLYVVRMRLSDMTRSKADRVSLVTITEMRKSTDASIESFNLCASGFLCGLIQSQKFLNHIQVSCALIHEQENACNAVTCILSSCYYPVLLWWYIRFSFVNQLVLLVAVIIVLHQL